MRKPFALWCAALAVAGATAAAADAAADAPRGSAAAQRVEARSADLLVVGVVRGDRMSIHLSRVIDNAPLRDAAVTVVLRGAAHPTTAETDGSFTLQAPELVIAGATAVEFQVAQAAGQQSLTGTLQIAGAGGRSEDKNSARQLWWWVLNFAVCIGFLWLVSRRRKS